jgi:CheY-like chemotaxis protein
VEALEKARELKPDLVVLDHSMPRMNGLEAATALRPIVPNVPIIMFTLYKDRVLSQLARKAGVKSVLSKTDELNALLKEVQRLVNAA